MTLTRLAVRRPVGVTMCVLAFLLLSAIAYQNIGLDLLPDLELPIAAVAVVYPGADPATVETAITAPIENVVAGVPGLQRLRSVSAENVSLILADFRWGTNMDAAVRDLSANVSAVTPLLPAEATEPVVLRVDPSSFPTMLISVSGDLDAVELTRRVEELVVPRLQSVPGVASVEVLGGARAEIAVRYDSEALAEHGITPTLLYQVLRFQNTVVPSGTVTEDGRRYQVRAGRQISGLEELKSQPVAQRQAAPQPGFGIFGLGQSLPVQLREVADVAVEVAPRSGATRLNGKEAVLLRVIKASGANTVAVADRVRAAARDIERLDVTGLTFEVITDQADLIRLSLGNVASSALAGAVLAVAVLFFFLRNLTPVIAVAAAVPLSLIGAGTALYFSGITLNLMSLAGLAISAGALVDNAIVVVENMTRHRAMGKSPLEAASDGGSEVGPAIAAATLTTLAVFIPIAFVKDLTGQLLKDMSIAVCAALVLSLAVALTVVPAAFARWESRRETRALRESEEASEPKAPVSPAPFPSAPQEPAVAPAFAEAAAGRLDPGPAAKHAEPGRSGPARKEFARIESTPTPETPRLPEGARRGGAPSGRMQEAYARSLRKWLSRPWLGVAATAAIFVALVLLPLGHPWTFLPEMDGGLITVSVSLPPGSPLEETLSVVESYERAIMEIGGIETIFSAAGDQGSQSILSLIQNLGVHEASMTLVLAPRSERAKPASEIAREIRQLRVRDGVRVVVQADRTAAALGDDYFPGVTLHLTGPDLEDLRAAARAIVAELEKAPGLANVSLSLEDPQPELFFRVTDRSFQGVLAGGEPLTAGQVGLALRNHLTGTVATYIVSDGARLPVVLRPASEEAATADALREFRVPGATLSGGGARPILGRIADVVEVDGPVAVDRLNRQRLVTVRAEADGIGLAEARALALDALSRVHLPPGVTVNIAGIHQVIDDTVSQMGLILLVGVFLVYAVMAAQFESVKQPLILMITVPLGLAGAVAALRLSGHPFSMPAAIGMVILAGIAVNNGIVMIDYINRLRRDGLAAFEAIVQGAAARLRPVLMTSITTILGLVPLALSRGHGSELQVPLAIALLGGMLTSTVLTLYLLPSILLIADGRRRPMRRSAEVAAPLLLALLAAFGVQGDALAAETKVVSHDTFAGALVTEGESPVYLVGARASGSLGPARLSVGAAGGLGESAPLVLGLEGALEARPSSSGRIELSAAVDLWLHPSPAHESRVFLSWNNAAFRGQVGVAHASGNRTPHPWSGRIPLGNERSWELSVRIEDSPRGSVWWDRDLRLRIVEDRPPEWLFMNGATARAEDFVRVRANAGLWLQAGSYAPLFSVDAVVTLLPHGEVEITIGPNSGIVPPGWPVFGLGYRGEIGAFGVAARAESGSGPSGFERRAYVGVTRRGSPYTLRLTWSQAATVSSLLSLHYSF